MTEQPDKKVLRDTDAEAIAQAKTLIRTARHGALAVIKPGDSLPGVSRVQLSTDTDGSLLTLVSSLSPHTGAMLANPKGAILIGEVGKGDPLAYPRITVFVEAEKLPRDSDDHALARLRHLARHPKAALYADFGDFAFFRLKLSGASLNGGFGKAYELTADDLAMIGDVNGLRSFEVSAVQHMNADHADAVALYATHFGRAKADDWQVATLDPEGMTLTAGDKVARAPFPRPLADADDLRSTLSLMAKQARAAQETE